MQPKNQQKRKKRSVIGLPVLRQNVAGIDIGSREHYVAGPVPKDGSRNVRSFATTTEGLEEMVAWLEEQSVESVAMESTGVYWIPAYELLESHGIEVLLVNSRQTRNVTGRKTDVSDSEWIQRLHSCGLLTGSFRPDEAICRLRAIKRQCSNLVEERTKAMQWIQKSLNQMNVQVHYAVTDLSGKTGMAIVRAIVAGERDPLKLAAHRDMRCKKSEAQIAAHLNGNWRVEHLFNLENALELYDRLDTMIASYSARLLEEMVAFQPEERRTESVPDNADPRKQRVFIQRGQQTLRESLWRVLGVDLTSIGGINAEVAMTIFTEIGHDMTRFPTEKKFAAWLRLTPRHGITGGKPIKAKMKSMGANRISKALRMGALSLAKSKTALGAYYRKISRRKGASVAIFATARKLATLVYRMLRFGQDYVDEGEKAYEARFQERKAASMKKELESLGYEVRLLAT